MKKCNACRKNLLALERPDRPAASTAAHLAECAPCRSWQRRLLLAERAVARLAVPPSEEARAALLRRLIEPSKPAVAKPAPAKTTRRSVAMILGSWIMDPHASPRRRVGAGMVAGIAAILLLSFGGWMFWYMGHRPSVVQGEPAPKDTLLAELRRKKLDHVPSEHATPQERVRGMVSVADELVRRSDTKAQAPEELANLAQLYVQVVDSEIVPQSGLLSPEDRVKLITQFEKAESLASRSAADQALPRASRDSFDRIAVASREAHNKLRNQREGIPT